MTSKMIKDIALDVLKRTTVNLPQRGIVHAIDGMSADVRIRGSGAVLRNIPIVGDVGSLAVGQTVLLTWSQNPGLTGPHPVILAPNSYS